MGLGESDMQRLDQIIGRRRKVPKDSLLYRMDDTFTNLYAIRLGHFKTYQVSAGGEQQITGFQMSGELLGMDAISTDRHHCDAMALEDSEEISVFGTVRRMREHRFGAVQNNEQYSYIYSYLEWLLAQ